MAIAIALLGFNVLEMEDKTVNDWVSDGTLVFVIGAAYDSWDTVLKGTATVDVGGNDNEHELCSFSILRRFALIVSARPYCARKSKCRAMPRHASSARKVLKWTMIGQMAIAIALTILDVRRPLLFFSDTFFSYNYLHIVQKWTKNQSGKLKIFQDFCPLDIESCHLAAARRVKLWPLNANLFFKEPNQLIKFA